MHKRCKITTLHRKEIYAKYSKYLREYKLKHLKTWWSKTKIIKVLAIYYDVHYNTILKIVERWRKKDFTIHSSKRNDYKLFKMNIRKLDNLSVKLKRIAERKKGIVRYEKKYAWELWHMDVHKVKNIRWENPKKKKYMAALEDDATRIVYSEIMPNKKAKTLAWFLKRWVDWFKKKDIVFKAILTDNWKEFTVHHETWRKLHSFEVMMRKLLIIHKYTRIRRPQTNWKVERWWKIFEDGFFRISRFDSWKDFNMRLKDWLHHYNFHRKHWGLKYLTPWQKYELVWNWLILKN